MSRFLDKVVEEMGAYADMGLPDGDTAMGMGSASMKSDMPSHGQEKLNRAYRLYDLLKNRNQAEMEEEGTDEGADSTEELKIFFKENPFPSDEEIAQYAAEHEMDLQQMRQAVYKLIQELMGAEDQEPDYGADDYDNTIDTDSGEGDADTFDFSTKS